MLFVRFVPSLASLDEVHAIIQAERKERQVGGVENEELPITEVCNTEQFGNDERGQKANERTEALGA